MERMMTIIVVSGCCLWIKVRLTSYLEKSNADNGCQCHLREGLLCLILESDARRKELNQTCKLIFAFIVSYVDHSRHHPLKTRLKIAGTNVFHSI